MIKKLLQKLKTQKIKRQINKPRYPIYSLITGEIVWLSKRTRDCTNTEYLFRNVKDFAIFELNGLENFHIVSNQNVDIMEDSNEKDYAIKDWQMFEEHPIMKMYMRKHNLDEYSLLSFAQIVALEKAMNKEHEYKYENDKMFC